MASDDAGRLLHQVEKKTQSLRGFKFHATDDREYLYGTTAGQPPRAPYKAESTVELSFLRPNLFSGEEHESNFPGSFRSVSDGKNLYFVNKKAYTKSDIDPKAANFHWYHNDLLLFYVTGSLDKAIDPPYPAQKHMLPDETWNGDTYRVIGVHVGGGVPIDYKLYVGQDLLLHRVVHSEKEGDRSFTMDFTLTGLDPNAQLTADNFAFHPDSDLKETPPVDYYKDNPQIKAGAIATEFNLPTPAGNRLSVHDVMVGKKAILLNFWFVGCPPCRAEHPKLERLYCELKDKGFGMIAVDDQDTADRVAKYLHDAKLDFPTVLSGPMAAIDPKTGIPNYRGPKLPDYASLTPYGIHECPTNVLLDENMKVVYVANEWNEKALREKLRELGIE